jgi:tetratricopeptide (TPR) repeat protein
LAQLVFRELRPFGLLYGMQFRPGFKFLVVATTGMLVAGCHSSFDPDKAASTSNRSRGSAAPRAGGSESIQLKRSGNADLEEFLVPSTDSVASSQERERVEAHAHYAAAVVRELNGESQESLEEYYQSALKDLDDEILVLDVSRRFLVSKQPERALELVNRAAALPNASGSMYARLGFIYAQLGKPDLAVNANRLAIKKDPHSLAGYHNLFQLYLGNKQVRDALSLLDEAAKVSRTDAEFLIGLAELYATFALQVPSQKKTADERGLAVLRRAAKLPVDDPHLQLRLANALNLAGDDEAAARVYRELLEQLPEAPFLREGVQSKLANIYLRQRDLDRATELLENIIRENPTDAQAYYFLGSIAYDQTNYARATEHFSKTLLLSPEFEPAYYDLATAQIGAEKLAEAMATLERARQKFSPGFMMEYLTGIIFSSQKDFTNAVKHLTAAEIIAQASDQRRLTYLFYFELGTVWERKGDHEQAEKYFEKCLVLAPNFAEAQNYLGYMWADRGEKLDRARELIERALKAEPESPAFLDSMGWVLFKLQQPKQALPFLLDAVKREEDATVYDHLGDVYLALGQTDRAREAWQKSLSLEESETVRKKLGPGGARKSSE